MYDFINIFINAYIFLTNIIFIIIILGIDLNLHE